MSINPTVKQRSTLGRIVIWILVGLGVAAAGWMLYESYLASRSMTDRGNESQWYRLIGSFVTNLIFTTVLVAIGLLYLWVRFASSLPDLQGWHVEHPESEFCSKDATEDYTFDDYLSQEAKIFDELDSYVTGSWANQQPGTLNRFDEKSVCNPSKISDRNWNRTHVLKADAPIGGVLLIHGLSDAPYSLRTLGNRLHAEGYTVIWLRVPGHGTCPAGLANVTWQDWTSAVQVAMRGLKNLVPNEKPLYLGGYSNGGALSTHYALSAIEDTSLPKVRGVVLFSPMIGINPLARITRLYHTVALISQNRKAQWSNISAEIDPYKYSSWPMNASVQAWSMTKVVERKLAALSKTGQLDKMPPVLALQSVVDSTVIVPNLITVLFDQLTSASSELFLFDINRADWLGNLFNRSFEDKIKPKLSRTDLRYRLCVLSNQDVNSDQVKLQRRDAESWTEEETGLSWPDDVASLSHIAVTIPPEDPIYGTSEATKSTGLALGSLSMRAEPAALMISDSLFVRCRHNPFYNLMEDRVVDWIRERACSK